MDGSVSGDDDVFVPVFGQRACGKQGRYGHNVAAIRALKAIEAEGRTATPQEQEILSRYVGWGGLPNAFDENKEDWKKEYAELKSLLTPEEYDMARASTLNAHYTSPTVIRAIYDAVESMGFRTGNLLEIKTQNLIQNTAA